MRKRNHVIPVRLNTKELRFLEEQVEKSGLSREEYIRSIVMGGEVRARPCEHHTELLRKVSGLCNNANQLAHVANGCGMAGEENIREMLRMTKRDMEAGQRGMVADGIHQYHPGQPSGQFHYLHSKTRIRPQRKTKVPALWKKLFNMQ